MAESDGAERPRRPFTWRAYLASIALASVAIVAVGLAIDSLLLQNGLRIHVGLEAVASAFFGWAFMVPCILIVWRIGLVTLGHYVLGVVLLFLPATLITLAIYPLFDVWIAPPEGVEAELLTFSAFVRLLRGAVLAPVAIVVFWFSYHVWFRATPRR